QLVEASLKESSVPSLMVSMFRKRASCPTSQDLLGYHLSSVTDEERPRIQGHLLSCDFCNAELQLLTRHRGDVEEDAFVEMPSPPCARATCSTTATPRPVPPSSRERARSTR